mgnify:FL=1
MKFEVDIDDDLYLELQKRAQELDLCYLFIKERACNGVVNK